MRKHLISLLLLVGAMSAMGQRPLHVRFTQPAPEPGEYRPDGAVDPQW